MPKNLTIAVALVGFIVGARAGHASQILNLAVSATGAPRIERYDAQGNYLGGFTTAGVSNIAIDSMGATYAIAVSIAAIPKYDEQGNFASVLIPAAPAPDFLTCLGVDHQNQIYALADFGQNTDDKILRFAADGTPLGVFATPSPQFGLKSLVSEIEFDIQGRLYAINRGVIERFDSTGASLGPLPGFTAGASDLDFNANGNFCALSGQSVYLFDSNGVQQSKFATVTSPNLRFLQSIALDDDGNVFVSGREFASPTFVERYSASGAFLGRTTGFRGDILDMDVTQGVPEPRGGALGLAAFAAFAAWSGSRRGSWVA